MDLKYESINHLFCPAVAVAGLLVISKKIGHYYSIIKLKIPQIEIYKTGQNLDLTN